MADVVGEVRAAAGSVLGDVASGRWRRAGIVGISLGVVAAGAAAGVAIERLTVNRDMRRRAEREVDAASAYGTLHGPTWPVPAPDGTLLHAEPDGTGWPGGRPPVPPTPADGSPAPAQGPTGGAGTPGLSELGRRPRRGLLARLRGAEDGPLGGVLDGSGSWLGLAHTPPLTVVFCHGYCLNEDCWHFQREAFRSGLRLVFWDQRSHGRSERSRSHLAGEPASIDQLGGDLKAVIDALAPTGPLVLVGHSMGGMTVMALADQHPELFAERVAGVALLGTTAGGWSEVTLGLGGIGSKLFHRISPGMLKVLGRQRALVERGRRLSSELTAAVYDIFSFGSDVDPSLARFARRMLEATPIDVVAEFFPVFSAHDKTAALPVLRDIPTLVMGGTEDLLTPASHSAAIAEALPDAELEILPDTGHLLMLERPAQVNAALARLLSRAAARSGAPLPAYVDELANEPAQEGN